MQSSWLKSSWIREICSHKGRWITYSMLNSYLQYPLECWFMSLSSYPIGKSSYQKSYYLRNYGHWKGTFFSWKVGFLGRKADFSWRKVYFFKCTFSASIIIRPLVSFLFIKFYPGGGGGGATLRPAWLHKHRNKISNLFFLLKREASWATNACGWLMLVTKNVVNKAMKREWKLPK